SEQAALYSSFNLFRFLAFDSILVRYLISAEKFIFFCPFSTNTIYFLFLSCEGRSVSSKEISAKTKPDMRTIIDLRNGRIETTHETTIRIITPLVIICIFYLALFFLLYCCLSTLPGLPNSGRAFLFGLIKAMLS
ncbi:MAG: hypothetical protein WCF67_00030, partial [Chitinophagaceae bacterium]